MTISQFMSNVAAALRFNVVLYWILTTSLATVFIAWVRCTPCTNAIASCLILVLTFVGSLYVWTTAHHRDHPTTIKKRCVSVFVTSIWSPVFVYVSLRATGRVNEGTFGSATFWKLLGFRTECLVTAIIVPLALTMVLFLGPLLMRAMDGVFWLYFDRRYWLSNIHNLVWIRNQAPFSEEFSFRACMLPLLVQCLSNGTAIAVCPLFFGIVFLFTYTTVFGAYSAFLFLRTGHFVAPFVVHAFCNHMGFPDFSELFACAQPKRTLLSLAFVLGLVSWCLLLLPMTDPSVYQNTIY